MSMTRRRLLDDTYKQTAVGNPIKVRSVARMRPEITMQGWTEQKKYDGNNLFDASNFATKSQGGATVTNNGDGSFTVSGSGDINERFVSIFSLDHQETIKLFKAGELTLSTGEISYPYMTIIIKSGDGSTYFSLLNYSVSSQKNTITNEMMEDMTVTIGFFGEVGTSIKPATIRPMLYQNGDGTYEPYTGGAPSPSPDYPQEIVSAGRWNEQTQKYEYKVNVTGANLLDDSQMKAVDVNLPENTKNGFEISLAPGQYTISTRQKTLGTTCYLYGIVRASDGTYGEVFHIVTHVAVYEKNVTIKEGDTLIIYDAINNTVEVSKSLFDEYGFMINEGSTALPYEPYKSQTVTLTSDRPLTEWDRLEKRNGVWGLVYGSGTLVIPKTGYGLRSRGGTDGIYFYKQIPNSNVICLRNGDTFREYQYFNYFTCDNPFNIIGDYMLIYRSLNEPEYAEIRVGLSDLDVTTVEQFENILAGMEDIEAVYKAEEETFVPLSSSEQEALNALHTNNPTTVITNDQGCEMSLIYKNRSSGNLLRYKDLINPQKWIGNSAYLYFDISLKPNTEYQLSILQNNMYKEYKEQYVGNFAF